MSFQMIFQDWHCEVGSTANLKVFSKIDLRLRYHQLCTNDSDVPITFLHLMNMVLQPFLVIFVIFFMTFWCTLIVRVTMKITSKLFYKFYGKRDSMKKLLNASFG